jgi:DNA-binding transcriptional LysR family regulator
MPPPLLPHLEAFAAAAELGSFTAAARSMDLTQAAVSQRIQALERELRIPLFRREGGHAYLTDAGIGLSHLHRKSSPCIIRHALK